MADPFQGSEENLSKAIRELDERLRIARASELASFGHCLEAEEILCSVGISKSSAAELDLLARIHFRQGRFEDARKRWEQAIYREESRRSEFEECLRTLDAFANSRMRRRRIGWRITFALLAASLTTGIWVLVRTLLEFQSP